MTAKKTNNKILSIIIYLAAATALFLSIESSYATEKSETIVTTGVAMAGQPESRRNAIEDAMRNAVEEAMGTIVNVELLVKNKAIVNEKILSQTKGYIQKYKINSEEEKGGLYRVQIEAMVKLGKVRNDMEAAGLLMKRKQMPRLMVMTMPRNDPQVISPGKQYVDSVSGVVEEVFLKNKFSMVDVNQHISKQKLAQATGNRDKLVALARDTGAELLVLTDAIRYFERNVVLFGSNYDIYRSDIQLRIIETGTGKVIYSGSQQGEPSASMDAVYDASRALSNAAIESILQKWSSDVNNATTYKLTITRIDFTTLEKLEKKIRNISGVDNLYRRAFDSGQGRFDVEYRGTADDLIKKLKTLKSPGLSITGMSQQTIEAVAQ